MAKVMISVPDDLLERLDRRADERGLSRSGHLRDLAERDLADDDDARRREITRLLGEPGHYGGDGAQAIREMRDSR